MSPCISSKNAMILRHREEHSILRPADWEFLRP
jgi:hypothetical protein